MAERDANIPDDAAKDASRADGSSAGDGQTVIHELRDSEDESEDRIAALIESSAGPEEIAREVQSQEPADAADILETMTSDESKQVLNQMDLDSAAEAISHMELPLAVTVLEDLGPKDAGALLARMDPDDAADLLQELNKEDASEILRAMPGRQAAKLGQLALYDPQTAGGIMNADFLWVDAEGTVADAIETVRRHREKFDQPEILCLDPSKRLVGVVGMRDLLVSDGEVRLSEIMDREVDAVGPEVDSEEVAMAFDRYDYLSLPVIDQNNRVLGVVTIDDVVDIIQQEHTEDVFKQVGAGARESVYDRLPRKIRGRAPWLFINLATSLVAATVVARFQGVIESITLLAVLMPMIANQAGNAGQQSLAVTLRGLVLGEVRRGRTGPLLVREVLLGLVSGLTVGLVVALAVGGLWLLGVAGMDWRVGVIAGVAMAGALTIGCMAGTGIPLALEKFGLDPATGSTIFLTMITDSLSFLVFLGLAFALRGWLLGGV